MALTLRLAGFQIKQGDDLLDQLVVGLWELVEAQLLWVDPQNFIAFNRPRLTGLMTAEERVQSHVDLGVLVLDGFEGVYYGGGGCHFLPQLPRQALPGRLAGLAL